MQHNFMEDEEKMFVLLNNKKCIFSGIIHKLFIVEKKIFVIILENLPY